VAGRGRASWSDRWSELRNRLLRDPRFVRLASRLPGTRIVARRRARSLFDLCAGFVYSQVLLACVRLEVLEKLGDGPRTVDELGGRLDLTPAAARRLLDAAAALGLVERRSAGRYGLGALGASLLAHPGIAAMVEHHALLYADLADPVALLRGEQPERALGRYWPYAAAPAPERLADADVADYSRLMSATQAFIAEQVLDAHPLDAHRVLLDVGGGEGAFLAVAGGRFPGLRLMLFELPPVAERARAHLEAAGLAGRTQVFGGDFLADPLPVGADVVSLVRVVHDHDDAEAVAVLRAVRAALPDDGVLLLAEPMAGTAGAEPVGGAYFGVYLLAMGSGRARRPEELGALLRAAGFTRHRVVPTHIPLQAGLIVARP